MGHPIIYTQMQNPHETNAKWTNRTSVWSADRIYAF